MDRQMDEQTYRLGMDKCVHEWMDDILLVHFIWSQCCHNCFKYLLKMVNHWSLTIKRKWKKHIEITTNYNYQNIYPGHTLYRHNIGVFVLWDSTLK